MSDQERLDRLEAQGLAMHTPEFERQIAETMAERERDFNRVQLAEQEAQYRRAEKAEPVDLRHHITTAEVLWLCDVADEVLHGQNLALNGIRVRVMRALDAAEARDREATK